jgi:hypothetical protein
MADDMADEMVEENGTDPSLVPALEAEDAR